MEQRKAAAGRKKYAWILSGAATVLVIFAGIMLFGINRFSLTLSVLEGENLVLEYGEPYTDGGVRPVVRGTLFFRDGWTPDVQISVEGTVDETKLGRQEIRYHVQYHGMEASAVRTVQVMDTQCPVITLHSKPDYEPQHGEVYEEEGYTAYDNRDGDITDRVVRVEHLGLVTYSVLDSSGNPGYAQREIHEYDFVPPEITLNGYQDVTITAGTRYEDPGCHSVDNVDGDLTHQVSVEGEVIWYKKGIYTLTYTVTDSFGNAASRQRIVRVVPRPRQETVNPGNRVIYLTFDDGPGPYTEQLLQLLDSYDVQATFFVMDNGYYDVLKEITQRGHSIGVHTKSHNYRQIYASPEAFFEDLYGMQKIIEEHTGVKTWLMRFPGGSSNTVSCFNEGVMTTLTEAVEDAGFHYFDWNVDSNDAGGANKAETVYHNVTGGVAKQNVSVVLQHDIHKFSVDAVEKILIWGFENGYTFLPLREDSPAIHHGLNN